MDKERCVSAAIVPRRDRPLSGRAPLRRDVVETTYQIGIRLARSEN